MVQGASENMAKLKQIFFNKKNTDFVIDEN